MTLDEPLRDLLRERGATDDMLKWLENPEETRKTLRFGALYRSWSGDEYSGIWDEGSIWQGIPGAAVVADVDRNNGVITITTTGAAPGPIEPGHRVRPVDRRPYPVQMAEERARRRMRTR